MNALAEIYIKVTILSFAKVSDLNFSFKKIPLLFLPFFFFLSFFFLFFLFFLKMAFKKLLFDVSEIAELLQKIAFFANRCRYYAIFCRICPRCVGILPGFAERRGPVGRALYTNLRAVLPWRTQLRAACVPRSRKSRL